ncbi:MAG TPA: preprotein translocase subunit SecE [Capsulimonadaceae bacterium]|jgi:preprotein translocase SecE subunit
MPTDKKDDPRLVAARQRAERIAKAGPGANPQQAGQFIKETVAELKKTNWPSQQVLTKSTYVVLAFIVATAVWVGGLDTILTAVGRHIFEVGGR